MNANISDLISRIAKLESDLETELVKEIREKQRQFQFQVKKGKIAFKKETREIHKKLRQGIFAFLWESSPGSLLVAPIIYSLIIPLLLLDLWIWLYQTVCFPIYRIKKVDRKKYIILDRGKLGYLNAIERFNCNYCGYANGLIAYAREIASKTEQYFCPIKHARPATGVHARYRAFLDFGDSSGYTKELENLRKDLGQG